MLPPGVDLGDPRLTQGVVVAERTYTLPSGQFPEWPENSPFECDVDGRLLPPCWGERHMHAHYAVSLQSAAKFRKPHFSTFTRKRSNTIRFKCLFSFLRLSVYCCSIDVR